MATDEKDMISRAVERHGYSVQEWREGEDGLEGVLGQFRVIEEDEDTGLYDGDEGDLIASVVGAAEYGNQRVSFALLMEDYDMANEVRDLTAVEPV